MRGHTVYLYCIPKWAFGEFCDLSLQSPLVATTTTMSGVTILPFLVVFLILFTLAFGIIVAVIIAQYLKDRMGNRIRPKVSEQSPIKDKG